MFEFLHSVPVAVYAAFTASTITLAGLWLQNRGESARNVERLTHDASQRDREREMTIRRDVYLKAAEALAHAQDYLAGLANVDVSPQQQQTIIKGVGADLNKVHIVGSMPTVQAIVAANQFFAQAVSHLSLRRLPMQEITRAMEMQDAIIESAIARRDEALTTMKEMNRSGADNSKAWDVQHKIFHEEQRAIGAAFAEKERLQQELAQYQAKFLKRSAQAGLELGWLVVKANLAIRRELELDLDADEYLHLMQQSHAKLGDELDRFYQTIKESGAPDLSAEVATAAARETSREAPREAKAAEHPARVQVASEYAQRQLSTLARLNHDGRTPDNTAEEDYAGFDRRFNSKVTPIKRNLHKNPFRH